MQKYPNNLSQEDRRLARRWTLASVGFYGSVLAGFALYGAFHQPAANIAAVDPAAKAAAAKPPQDNAFRVFANARPGAIARTK
jgi:hypothetical protein